MIEYIKGDVTLAPEFVILQGCNAQGKMNSGVAKAIRDKWPEVFYYYSMEHEMSGLVLGLIYPAFVYSRDDYGYMDYPHKVIINGITQQYYGREPNRVYVDYDCMFNVFLETKRLMERLNQTTLATVKIGAGLGGGDWDKIEAMIKEVFTDMWVKIYVPE